jgi:hypothetical protein
MNSYQNLCYNVVSGYARSFDAPLDEHHPTIFNITGDYRNKYHEEYKARLRSFRIYMLLITVVVSALTSSWVVFAVSLATVAYVTTPITGDVTDFVNINGLKVAVVIPTQEEEGALEARNMEETKDVQRLYRGLGLNLTQKKNLVVVSVGSKSAQIIYGQEFVAKTEFDMGVDNRNNLQDVLDSVNTRCDYVCFMNAIGYGIRVDAGVVVSDNVTNTDDVTENIKPRTVGGTGNNVAAMTLVHQLLALHKSGKFRYKLAFVPRGDPAMPQGGSHSKQRLVDAIRSSNGMPVIVIEISGKQTKRFYIDAKDNDWELDRCSTEELCKLIKESKVVDENGKTYGSGDIL